MSKQTIAADPEFTAMKIVFDALNPLNAGSQSRVLKYVIERLGISNPGVEFSNHENDSSHQPPAEELHSARGASDDHAPPEDELEGISPAGKKWIARSGLKASDLAVIFSLGIDEIDLVAEKVPGTGKKERMRNVYLLKGMAAYLGTGVASFTQAQVKEALLQYDAFDTKNFATYFSSMSAEVSGTKETGYSLSARGISNATNLLKTMTKGTA